MDFYGTVVFFQRDTQLFEVPFKVFVISSIVQL